MNAWYDGKINIKQSTTCTVTNDKSHCQPEENETEEEKHCVHLKLKVKQHYQTYTQSFFVFQFDCFLWQRIVVAAKAFCIYLHMFRCAVYER